MGMLVLITFFPTSLEKNSLFNTPPVFPIYMVKLVLEWIQESGGMDVVEAWNEEKGRILYGAISDSDGFYRGTVVEEAHRSLMNATLRLPSEDLEKEFIATAAGANFHGLKGHRSVGGVRVSMYNAITVDQVMAFLQDTEVDVGPLERDLGYAPFPIEAGLRRVLRPTCGE